MPLREGVKTDCGSLPPSAFAPLLCYRLEGLLNILPIFYLKVLPERPPLEVLLPLIPLLLGPPAPTSVKSLSISL